MPAINRRTWLRRSWVGAMGAAGCAWLPREAVVPMPVIREPADAGRQAPVLAVMLPGVFNVPRDFIDQGFVSRLHAQGFAVDAVLADAHLGYAGNGTLLERVLDDVLLPAQREGYRRIWLVGISLGGFVSLGLLMRQPEMIEGIVAIAPFVGQRGLLREVAAAGGAAAYAKTAHTEGDLEAALWAWLGRASPAQRNKIHLYISSEDWLITGQRLLEPLLAADHVVEVPGKHDWPAWNTLWSRWLVQAPWPRA